ncbi:MAG: DUF4923 family protein [Bacteroidales bacterium]|nr:DUF4923 family protein [Bacteroidales bacterium]
MKTIKKIAALVALSAGIICAPSANAQSITDLLGGLTGNSTGSTIVNALEGVFSKSDITVADIAGEWKSTGPAVTFKSDNLLKKAGGIAGAAALETKLSPYYDQYGLNGMTMSIDNDGNFTMNIKKIQLRGVMTPNKGEGTFDFQLKALGKIPLGTFTAYVTTTGQSTDIMFDATKMKQLLSTLAKYTGVSLAKTAASILDSYDGACIGFKLSKTGNAPASDNSTKSTDSDSVKKGLGDLLNLLGN